MTLREQKELAAKHNLATSTEKKVIDNIKMELKCHLNIERGLKPDTWCIWSIGDSVEMVVNNALCELNDEYGMNMKSYVYDAHIGTTQEFASVMQLIRDTKENATLLIKNCTWTTPDVFRCIYNAVRYPDSMNPYVILTSPLELPEGEKEIWDRSLPVCHTVLLEKE